MSNIQVTNAAVFVQRPGQRSNTKRYTKATVMLDDSRLSVQIGTTIRETWEVAAVVKAGMAWDVYMPGGVGRVVAQQGCGCGGMRRYDPDPDYVAAN